MTGDETNKEISQCPGCLCMTKTIGVFCGKCESVKVVKEPVASKAGEGSQETIPCKPICPWCGLALHQVQGQDSFACENFTKCPTVGRAMSRSEWENTWAHKQIAALQREDRLQFEEFQKLQSQLESEKAKNTVLNGRIRYGACSSCIELEKRNAELESALAGTQKLIRDHSTNSYELVVSLRIQLDNLEQKIKSFEDALSVCEAIKDQALKNQAYEEMLKDKYLKELTL